MQRRTLSPPDRHALKIARDTMRMHCAGALILGGPNHVDAAETIRKLTGKATHVPNGCTCNGS